MSKLTEEEEKMLSEFKPGEYVTLTMLVKIVDLPKVMDSLKKSNTNIVVLPDVDSEKFKLISEQEGDKQ